MPIRLAAALLLALSLTAGAPTARAAPAADITLNLLVGGQQRTAFLHVPANLDPAREYPLVIGFHGGLGNAPGYIRNSDLFAKGERAGFIVVCPQGTPVAVAMAGDHRVWNSGPEYARATRGADDVAFTRALIDKIAALYPLDVRRVYATGFSNGAQMAYLLALKASDAIAAIAPMSGGRSADGLAPGRPVPVMHFHGTADGYYPFEGGRGAQSIGPASHVAIDAVIAEWRGFDNARARATIVTHEGWEMRVYDGAAPVSLVLVQGMGHQIAGGSDDHLPHQAMKSEPDAVAMALGFFGEHALP
jgi:polyhydroxybutyrate depolymerase